MPLKLISQHKLTFTMRNTLFLYKRNGALENLKTHRVPYLGIKLTGMSSKVKSILRYSPFKALKSMHQNNVWYTRCNLNVELFVLFCNALML
jgi:hypothetical protein